VTESLIFSVTESHATGAALWRMQ